MSRAEFERLTTEGLFGYLAAKEFVLDAEEQVIFRTQKIDGDSLLEMTKDHLVSCGVPMGVAVKIMKKILR